MTMGSLMAMNSGIPFHFPMADRNSISNDKEFEYTVNSKYR